MTKSGRYIYFDMLLCQNMGNSKNKHSGGVSCSACSAIFFSLEGVGGGEGLMDFNL